MFVLEILPFVHLKQDELPDHCTEASLYMDDCILHCIKHLVLFRKICTGSSCHDLCMLVTFCCCSDTVSWENKTALWFKILFRSWKQQQNNVIEVYVVAVPGAFNHMTWSSSVDEIVHNSIFMNMLKTFCPFWLKSCVHFKDNCVQNYTLTTE